ncbi:hypothetical protein HS7_03490 [Sulfolobales archaeon HS-7]|nr:hypothetical protein HS7_03490 [Sulfolobales archaeon HS-7]
MLEMLTSTPVHSISPFVRDFVFTVKSDGAFNFSDPLAALKRDFVKPKV